MGHGTPGSEQTPGDILEQTPTLRDAVFSAMTLDIFHQHPEKIAMATAPVDQLPEQSLPRHEGNFCKTSSILPGY